jgi:SAM-dependent methyltransferase
MSANLFARVRAMLKQYSLVRNSKLGMFKGDLEEFKSALHFTSDPVVKSNFIKIMKVKSYFQPCREYILDLGCGKGFYADYLSGLSEQVICVDMDLSEIMIAKGINCAKNQSYILASARNLPFQNNLFDIAFTKDLLHHTSPIPVIQEIKDTLKNKGQFVVIEAEKFNPVMILHRLPEGHYHFNGQQLVRIFKEEGFVIKKKGHIEAYPFYLWKPIKNPSFLESFIWDIIYGIIYLAERKKNILIRLVSKIQSVIEIIPLLNSFSAFNFFICEKLQNAHGLQKLGLGG